LISLCVHLLFYGSALTGHIPAGVYPAACAYNHFIVIKDIPYTNEFFLPQWKYMKWVKNLSPGMELAR